MAINVVCPGCLKRFQVSDRFAGMKGPCPNCNTVILIPKGEVKIHGAEDFEQGGKTASGKLILKPIDRLDMNFNPVQAGVFALGAVAVFAVAAMLGNMVLSEGTRNMIGLVGVFLVAFPLALFGYQVLRDREELFVLTGWDLYQKVGLCALAYAVLWILFELFIWYMNANSIFVWVSFAALAVSGMLAAHAILDIESDKSFLHGLIFFVTVILLRGLMNLGWLWIVAERVRPGALPPPPVY